MKMDKKRKLLRKKMGIKNVRGETFVGLRSAVFSDKRQRNIDKYYKSKMKEEQ